MREMREDVAEAAGAGMSALLAFTLGAVLGAATALLFAPRTGRETREYLADKGREIGEKARDVKDKTKDYFQGKKEDINEAVEAGRQAMQQERTRTQGPV